MAEMTVEQQLKKQKSKFTLKKNMTAWCYLFPFIFLFVFSMLPILLGVVSSFLYKYNPYDTTKTFFDFEFGIDNYIAFLGLGQYAKYGVHFWQAMGFTLLYAIVLVPLMILVPLGLAYLVNLKPPGYKVFRAIIYIPYIISASVMGSIFLFLFNDSTRGFINAVLGTNIHFISNSVLRFIVIVLASVWWQTGNNFLVFSAALRDVDKNLYEASSMDGCTKWEQFLYVTFPAIKQQFNVLLFTTVIGYLGLYSQVKIIRSPINGSSWFQDMETPMLILQEGIVDSSYFSLMGLFSASAVVYGAVVFTISQLQLKLTGEKKGGKHVYEEKFKLFLCENNG